jgi:hypothetical protein
MHNGALKTPIKGRRRNQTDGARGDLKVPKEWAVDRTQLVVLKRPLVGLPVGLDAQASKTGYN